MTRGAARRTMTHDTTLYRGAVSTPAPHHPSPRPRRTIWEEGRTPGPVLAGALGIVVFLVAWLDLAWFDRVSLLTDVAFGLLCVAVALLVRPRDFFVVGVCPPLLLVVVFAILSLLQPGAFGDPSDGLLQSVVSGLAHHARALVVGYGLTLVVLALRQVAIRHAGALHGPTRIGRGAADPPSGPRGGRIAEGPPGPAVPPPASADAPHDVAAPATVRIPEQRNPASERTR